jgi:hypothetical protein
MQAKGNGFDKGASPPSGAWIIERMEQEALLELYIRDWHADAPSGR